MTIFGGNGFKFDGRKLGLQVSRGDYVFRWGTLTITKLGADWFIEGSNWSFHHAAGGLVTVSQREPSCYPSFEMGGQEMPAVPTHH